jgi:hypothetical protein
MEAPAMPALLLDTRRSLLISGGEIDVLLGFSHSSIITRFLGRSLYLLLLLLVCEHALGDI